MNVAVLGSSGQIGAYLTDYLRKKGHFVREFDIANSYHEDMTHIPNPFLRNIIMDSDFVFFLAFDVGGSHYLKKYQHTFKFIDNNTRMMANVFGHLADYKKPFVFASSQMSNMSYSPYGVMKRVGELYTKSLGGLIVHFWNVYGIEKDMEKAHGKEEERRHQRQSVEKLQTLVTKTPSKCGETEHNRGHSCTSPNVLRHPDDSWIQRLPNPSTSVPRRW